MYGVTDKLSEALRLLAAGGPQDAPDAVERRLLTEFRRRNRWRVAVPWITGVAAAMAVATGLAIAWIPPAPPAPVLRLVYAEPPAMALSVPIYAAVKTPVNPPVKRPARAPEAVEAFIPFPYSGVETLPDSGQVIRVRLSRSALAQAGFSVGGDLADSRVDADVLVGNDGTPLALHFVNSSFVQ